MLTSIKCKVEQSIRINFTFDDSPAKNILLNKDDIIDIDYVINGTYQTSTGKITKVYGYGENQSNWYICLDKSEDYGSSVIRIPVMNILDVDIISSFMDHNNVVTENNSATGIKAIRLKDNVIQYTQNGSDWFNIKVHKTDVIEPTENGSDTSGNDSGH